MSICNFDIDIRSTDWEYMLLAGVTGWHEFGLLNVRTIPVLGVDDG
ncbi:hypothetical protein [Arcanobacterium ihumii]|nr:hypothetical protein [Arcanobacterium ihumii]